MKDIELKFGQVVTEHHYQATLLRAHPCMRVLPKILACLFAKDLMSLMIVMTS